MGPAKGRDVDQAELRLRLSASLRPCAAAAHRRHRAWRRWTCGARRATPSASTASSASWSTARARTRAPRLRCARSADTAASRSSSIRTSTCSSCSAARIGRPEERFVKALLHPLWDLRFQVGHHVRELADFDRLDTTNPEYLLALMDLRPLAGDRDAHAIASTSVMKSSAPAWRPQILDALVDADRSAPQRVPRHALPARARRERRPRRAARRLGDAH